MGVNLDISKPRCPFFPIKNIGLFHQITHLFFTQPNK